MDYSFNCIGILKMEWAVLQFKNRVAVIPDDTTAICYLFAIFILASNKLIKKIFPVPAGASRKNNCPSSLFTLCKILL